MYDIVEYVDRVRPSELDDSDKTDSEENVRLVGVSASDPDEIDKGSCGTGVSGARGDNGVSRSSSDGVVPGMVSIPPIEDGEPLGLKMEVSNDVSSSSCRTMECTEGDGWRIVDSYETSEGAAHARGIGGASEDEDAVNVDTEVVIDDSVVSSLDWTVVGAIIGVEGGSVDAVDGDNIPIDAGVTTDVDPSVDIGRDDNKLKLTDSSSSSSVRDDSVVNVVVGQRPEVGVCTSCSSSDLSRGDGAGDISGDRDSDCVSEASTSGASSNAGKGGKGGDSGEVNEAGGETGSTGGDDGKEGNSDSGAEGGSIGGDPAGDGGKLGNKEDRSEGGSGGRTVAADSVDGGIDGNDGERGRTTGGEGGDSGGGGGSSLSEAGEADKLGSSTGSGACTDSGSGISSGSSSDKNDIVGDLIVGTTEGVITTLGSLSGSSSNSGRGPGLQRCSEDIVGVLASDGIVPISSSNTSAVSYTDTASSSDGSEAVLYSVSIPGSDAVRYDVDADSAVRYSDSGINGKDSKEVIDAPSESALTNSVLACDAVMNSVLACDAVTNFSEATSEIVSEPYESGVGASVNESDLWVKSVRSEDGQTS